MIGSTEGVVSVMKPSIQNLAAPFFDSDSKPTIKLVAILKLLGMPSLNPSEKAILQINRFAQENLLRKGERWEEQSEKFEALKPCLKPLLKELGFVKAKSPQLTKYEGAIVHGALLPSVRLRLQYLIDQWNKGVRFSKIYFLTGERPLEIEREGVKAMSSDEISPLKIRKDWSLPTKFPQTECEMIRLVWEQSEIPEEMRAETAVHFINAPMKANAKGEKIVRPTTDDTVEAWLKYKPEPGNYLAVSHAPYINRQDVVLKSLTTKDYIVDTVGPRADKKGKIAIFVDELARYIFQIKQISEK